MNYLKFLTFIVLFSTIQIEAQTKSNDTIYVGFDNNMSISEFDKEISLTISLFHSSDTKINSYNFKVDNLNSEFKLLSFKDIKNKIALNELKQIDLKTVKDLSSLEPCDLHYALSEAKHIYLIKKADSINYRYKLIYISTQRGWTRANTN